MFYYNGKACSALFFAAYYGARDIAELLIAKGASVHEVDGTGQTPLHVAATQGHRDVVEILIANGAPLNVSTNDSCSPLYLAAGGQHREVAQLLLDYGAVMEPEIAVLLGDVELFNPYLALGVDVNSRLKKGVEKGETFLIAAIGSRNKNFVELLLDRGAEVNDLMERHNVSPLHRASAIGCQDICSLLLARGADVNAKGNYGKTPLHLAAQMGYQHIVELLLDYGADINALDIEERSALFIAALRNYRQIVMSLLARGAQVNLTDKLGYTPLCLAINQSSDLEIVRLLVIYGADVNVQDPQGFSPLHRAVIRKNKNLVELLLAHGAIQGLN